MNFSSQTPEATENKFSIVYEQPELYYNNPEAELQEILGKLLWLCSPGQDISRLALAIKELCRVHSGEKISYRVSYQIEQATLQLIIDACLLADQVLISIDKVSDTGKVELWAEVIFKAHAHRVGRRHIANYKDLSYVC